VNDLGREWKWLWPILRHYPSISIGNLKTFQSGQPVSGPRFDPGTS
jgi:hypothetical protein